MEQPIYDKTSIDLNNNILKYDTNFLHWTIRIYDLLSKEQIDMSLITKEVEFIVRSVTAGQINIYQLKIDE